MLRSSSLLCSALVLVTLAQLLFPTAQRALPAPAPFLLAALALGMLAASLSAYAEITYGVKQARLAEKELRHKLLSSYLDRPVSSQKLGPAQQNNLMTASVERLADYRCSYWPSTLAALVTPLILLVFIGWLDPLTAAAIAALLPLLPCSLWLFFKLFRRVSANSRAQRAKLTVAYLEAIRELIPIRLFGAGQRVQAKLEAQGEQNRRAVMKLLAGNQLVIVVMDAVFLLALICWSTYIICLRSVREAMTAAEASTALLLLPLLLAPLTQVAGFFYIGMAGRAAQGALSRALKAAAQPQAPLQEAGSSPAAYDQRFVIEAQGLGYDYGRGPVFQDLTFKIPRGVKLALLGPSGAGKSTLLELLAGRLPLQEGSLWVNGQQAQGNHKLLLKQSATVSQDTWLFSGTIADNLRLANPTASQAQLWQVLEQTCLAQEVAAMPKQLETDLGEQGSRLSGGQAQRLSLARALLAGRPLLLLDEPTAHLDSVSEQGIIAALRGLDPQTTVVMATHRPALLCLADRVLRFDQEIKQADSSQVGQLTWQEQQ